MKDLLPNWDAAKQSKLEGTSHLSAAKKCQQGFVHVHVGFIVEQAAGSSRDSDGFLDVVGVGGAVVKKLPDVPTQGH